MTNNIYVDFHALQSVPPSNLNRDDTGSPKTALLGGVRRARVSSQSWKKAMRDAFVERYPGEEFGVRTLNAPLLLADELIRRAPDIDGDKAIDFAVKAFNAAKIQTDKKTNKTKALFFISKHQIRTLANIILTEGFDPSDSVTKKTIKEALNTEHAVDMALFGRMVADDPVFNVDAACQVAHAIGVSKVVPEFDYFTAVDDDSREDHAGAGMIGTIEYDSSTFYRYANIGMTQLMHNLGSKSAAVHAVSEFLDVFCASLPSGKQNTFAAQTLPSAVLVEVRTGRPVSYVNAFELPVEGSHNASVIDNASARLSEYAQSIRSAYSLTPDASFVMYLHDNGLSKLGEPSNYDELRDRLTEQLDSMIPDAENTADGE